MDSSKESFEKPPEEVLQEAHKRGVRDVTDDLKLKQPVPRELIIHFRTKVKTNVEFSCNCLGQDRNIPPLEQWEYEQIAVDPPLEEGEEPGPDEAAEEKQEEENEQDGTSKPATPPETEKVREFKLTIPIPNGDCAFARSFVGNYATFTFESIFDDTVPILEKEENEDQENQDTNVEKGEGADTKENEENVEEEEQPPPEKITKSLTWPLHSRLAEVRPESRTLILREEETIEITVEGDILATEVREFLCPLIIGVSSKSLKPLKIYFPGEGPPLPLPDQSLPLVLFPGTWDIQQLKSDYQTERLAVEVEKGVATFLMRDLLYVKKMKVKAPVNPTAFDRPKNTSVEWDINHLIDNPNEANHTYKHVYIRDYMEDGSQVKLDIQQYKPLHDEKDDIDTEPIGVLVVLIGHKAPLFTKKFLQYIVTHNTNVMEMGAEPSKAITERQLTPEEKNDPSLDIFTGFVIHTDGPDGSGGRLIVVEGLKHRGIKELSDLAEEWITCKSKWRSKIKLLFHEKINWKKRMYIDFNLVLKQIKFSDKLENVAHRSDLVDSRKIPASASLCLNNLMAIRNASRISWVKANKLLPGFKDLQLAETMFGSYVTDEELIGDDRGSAEEPRQIAGRKLTLANLKFGSFTSRNELLKKANNRDRQSSSEETTDERSEPDEENATPGDVKTLLESRNLEFDHMLWERKVGPKTDRIKKNMEAVALISARNKEKSPRVEIDETFLGDEVPHVYSTQKQNTINKQLEHFRATLDVDHTLYETVAGSTFQPTSVDSTKYYLRQEDISLRLHGVPEFRYPRARSPAAYRLPPRDISEQRKDDLHEPYVEEKQPYLKGKPEKGRFDARTLIVCKPRVKDVPPHNKDMTLDEIRELNLTERNTWKSKIVVKNEMMKFGEPKSVAILQDPPQKLALRFNKRKEGPVALVDQFPKPISAREKFTNFKLTSNLITPFAKSCQKSTHLPNIRSHVTPREKRFITALTEEDRERWPHPPNTARVHVRNPSRAVQPPMTAR